MPNDAREELRALALWHTRRRLVDELLDPLLEYGPAAVDRVAERLAQVESLVESERQAFLAFAALVAERREPSQRTAVVLDLFPVDVSDT
jgi:hypothetical protein